MLYRVMWGNDKYGVRFYYEQCTINYIQLTIKNGLWNIFEVSLKAWIINRSSLVSILAITYLLNKIALRTLLKINVTLKAVL